MGRSLSLSEFVKWHGYSLMYGHHFLTSNTHNSSSSSCVPEQEIMDFSSSAMQEPPTRSGTKGLDTFQTGSNHQQLKQHGKIVSLAKLMLKKYPAVSTYLYKLWLVIILTMPVDTLIEKRVQPLELSNRQVVTFLNQQIKQVLSRRRSHRDEGFKTSHSQKLSCHLFQT